MLWGTTYSHCVYTLLLAGTGSIVQVHKLVVDQGNQAPRVYEDIYTFLIYLYHLVWQVRVCDKIWTWKKNNRWSIGTWVRPHLLNCQRYVYPLVLPELPKWSLPTGCDDLTVLVRSFALVSPLWLRGCRAICALVTTGDRLLIAGDLKAVDLVKWTSMSEKYSISGFVNFISPWLTHFCSSGGKALRNQFAVALSTICGAAIITSGCSNCLASLIRSYILEW